MQTFTNYKVDSNVTDDYVASGSYSASFGVSRIVAFLSLSLPSQKEGLGIGLTLYFTTASCLHQIFFHVDFFLKIRP